MAATTDIVLRVAPRRSLLVTALLSVLLVLGPVSAVLYWYAVPRGQGAWIALGQVVVVLGSLVVLLRQLTVDTVVDATELRGRGIFSPLVRVPLSSIARVDIVPVYVGQSPEPVRQLLVRDAEGRRLYRMRGHYWYPGDLERVAAALPVPVNVATEPISPAELFTVYPGSAYWFENRPWLVALLVGFLAGVALAVGLAINALFSIPV